MATSGFDTLQAVGPVRSSHTLDQAKLSSYIAQHLGHPPTTTTTTQPLEVLQFKHGQSNPTYLLRLPDASLVVLRKKPAGKILASAHAVEREHQVLAALGPTCIPVPRVILSCDDPTITGTPFYLMEFVPGRIYVDPNLPDLPPATRRTAYRSMASTLASLHSVNAHSVNLASYGNPDHYCRRQLTRWLRQYHASTPSPTPEMLGLAAWLQSNIPPADACPPHPTICHGDYRIDNLVYAPDHSVRAVLDWELSTLGNPWADVAYSCLPYHFPPEMSELKGFASPLPGGIPTEQEYVSWYCEARGVEPPNVRDWAFYSGLSVFRLAAILAGVQARARQGNASSERARQLSSQSVIDALAGAALQRLRAFDSAAAAAPCPAPQTACTASPCLGTSSTSCACPSAGCSNGQCRQQGGQCGQTGQCGRQQCGQATGCCGQQGAKCGQQQCGQQGGQCGQQQGQGAPAGGASAAAAGAGAAGACCNGACGCSCSGGGMARAVELAGRVRAFIEEHVRPVEATLQAHADLPGEQGWTVHPLHEQLKACAKAEGLWNLWLPAALAGRLQHLLPLCGCPQEASVLLGAGLSNEQYAVVCEPMGSSVWAPEVFNCSAPDTGNMEVIAKYGSEEQQRRWLLPLLQGDIRSCFAMTERAVASSDATNIQASIRREGGGYVLNGVKWWTSGASDPRTRICIFMGKTDPSAAPHKQQSMVLVPMDAPGVKLVRPMQVFGFNDAPHGHAEVHFKGVRVPLGNMILGEGRGFEIAQGRLGPGRLHHCMRLVGGAEHALGLMAERGLVRQVFGGPLAKQGGYRESLARCRIEVNSARLLVLEAARQLDRLGGKGAKDAIAVAKVAAPAAALKVLDAAIQVHGGAGVSQDFPLARLWAHARTLRIADGPDEVHLLTIARSELQKAGRRARL